MPAPSKEHKQLTKLGQVVRDELRKQDVPPKLREMVREIARRGPPRKDRPKPGE